MKFKKKNGVTSRVLQPETKFQVGEISSKGWVSHFEKKYIYFSINYPL